MLTIIFNRGGGAAAAPPLTVTIEQAAGQLDPTSIEPLLFTVSFSTAVSDFTAEDVTVSGTASAGTSVAVTNVGDDQTFTVSVTGLTQPGTVIVTIAAGVAHDSSGTPNNASTSFDDTITFMLPGGGSSGEEWISAAPDTRKTRRQKEREAFKVRKNIRRKRTEAVAAGLYMFLEN